MNKTNEWKEELLLVGNIIQDSDESVPQEEAKRRFNRYIEMLDDVDGSEDPSCARAIFASVQAVDDYGAYQTTERAAWKFGEKCFCEALLQELPRLIKDLPDWAGNFLVSIANAQKTEHESIILTFNQQLSTLLTKDKEVILNFIYEQEKDGWFEHRLGVLGGKV